MVIFVNGGKSSVSEIVDASTSLIDYIVLGRGVPGQVPKLVLLQFNKLFSTFFWGSINGSPKRKLIKWERLCKPVDEGGHLLEICPSRGTRFWKAIVKEIHVVLSHSKWKIKEGNVLLWRDSWLNSGPLMEQYPMVGDLELKLVGPEKKEEIVNEISSGRTGKDQLIWLENSNGSFTTKTAWSFVWISNPKCQWSDWIWNSALPKKFSVLMWKALNSCLVVDNRIRRLGVSLVSKCECCREGAVEDINHELYSGNIAKAICKFSSNTLGIPFVPFRSWRATVEAWFRRASKSSQLGTLIGVIPVIITWNLWKWRCTTRMEGRKEKVQVLWRLIKYWINWVGIKIHKDSRLVEKDVQILKSLNLSINSKKNEILMAVRWERPKKDWFKLNVDGSSINNPEILGARGVVRNELGKMVFAIAESIRSGSNNLAEVIALRRGLEHCKRLGLNNIIIEMDSLLVANWVQDGRCSLWT
ncbi:uncharacterized protein LOC118348151 [Juglans regia]|uniref:Uncharacterized protein LOC118348149 n=1 Tax=Juglans regia TaxID=51240 RepID=A0A6P9EMB2_JUGRE|nr:uncharacterized protein LOC118348149 [Juglans regia]XP_035545035.1 uncharacterized protein LOC118348151 [Juglans regia]